MDFGWMGFGEFYFAIEADRETGVIDMFAGPTPDEMALFPTRVVPLAPGRCAYSLTMFQAPHMTDDVFKSQHRSLLREFDHLRARFA